MIFMDSELSKNFKKKKKNTLQMGFAATAQLYREFQMSRLSFSA